MAFLSRRIAVEALIGRGLKEVILYRGGIRGVNMDDLHRLISPLIDEVKLTVELDCTGVGLAEQARRLSPEHFPYIVPKVIGGLAIDPEARLGSSFQRVFPML